MDTHTLRHLLGGFFGGVLGTLLLGYFGTIPMVAGCLIGSAGGFWHDVIVQAVMTEVRKKNRRFVPHPLIFRFSVEILALVALVVTAIAFLIGVVNAGPYLFGDGAVSGIWITMWVIGTVVGTFINGIIFVQRLNKLVFQEKPENVAELKTFYEHWQEWSKTGTLWLGLTTYFALVRGQFVAMTCLFGAFCSFVAIVVAAFLPSLVIALVLGTAKGVVLSIRRGGYWICFITSMVTTVAFAYMMHGRFESQVVLLLTALAAGVVSAAGSEALHQGTRVLLAQFPSLSEFGDMPVKTRVSNYFDSAYKRLEEAGREVLKKLTLIDDVSPAYLK